MNAPVGGPADGVAVRGGMVLLTGASGFVGRQVLRALLSGGWRVRAVAREGGEADPRRWVDDPAAGIDRSAGHLEIRETPDLFREPADRLTSLVTDVDTIVHAAWYAEPGSYLVSPRNLDCLHGTLGLARAFVESGGRRFVGIGSCFEYDLTGGHLPVTTPLAPLTPYAASKVAAFLALTHYLPPMGVEFAWCRLFHLFGEGERAGRLVPYLRQRLAAGEPAELTSGTQVRDYLDVRDAGARIAAVATGVATGPINICSGVPVTVREIAERIADEYGARHLLRWGSRPENLTDPPVVVGVPGQRSDPDSAPRVTLREPAAS